MSTTGLKRVLGLPEITFIAIGFTIGGGIFVFTGIVMKITGPALPLAYSLAVIPVIISMLPLAMLGSAVPATGGNYIYPSRMVSPALAFVGVWTYILASFFGQIPLYAIACAKYTSVFIPGLPVELFAIGLLTLFFLVNILGIRLAAFIQGIMVIILIAALLFYSVKGMIILNPEHFNNFFQKGAGNIMLGTALLTFTYFGANGIIELGGEIKNPGRVIPRAFAIAFPVITAIYILVSLVTVGTIMPDNIGTHNEPLIAAGRLCFKEFKPGFTFFIIGGAILALTTTLNALFLVSTKSLLAMIQDNMLPKGIGKLHRRFGTAHLLLTIIWLLSVAGVLSGFSLETFASYAALGGMIIFFPVLIASLVLPGRFPKQYRESRFKLKGFWLWFCPFTGFFMIIFFSAIILIEMKSIVKIALFFIFPISGIIYFYLRKRYLLRQGINLSDITEGEDWIES